MLLVLLAHRIIVFKAARSEYDTMRGTDTYVLASLFGYHTNNSITIRYQAHQRSLKPDRDGSIK
jgi:hypothetical protein